MTEKLLSWHPVNTADFCEIRTSNTFTLKTQLWDHSAPTNSPWTLDSLTPFLKMREPAASGHTWILKPNLYKLYLWSHWLTEKLREYQYWRQNHIALLILPCCLTNIAQCMPEPTDSKPILTPWFSWDPSYPKTRMVVSLGPISYYIYHNTQNT